MADPAPSRPVFKWPEIPNVNVIVVKLVLVLILVAVAVLWFRGWLSDRGAAASLKATAAQQHQTAVAAETIATDLGEVQESKQVVEVIVTHTRETFNRRAEEVINANPTVRTYVATPVPDELRKLACERRIARERSDDPATGGKRTDGTAPSCG